MRRRSASLLLAASTASVVSLASAPCLAEPSATDRAVAQTLFDEGRVHMGQGRFTEACVAFARSQKLDPGAGTRLNLALCHEAEGKTATAWTELNEALSQAKRDHREDREQLAQQHIEAITPNVPHALLKLLDRSKGLELRLDDVLLDPGVWEGPIPIDPGEHVLSASAPGKKAWASRTRFAPGEPTQVIVPVLESNGAAEEGDAAAAASGHATLGWVLLGGGVASSAVGVYFGVRALNAKSDSDRLCPSSPCTDGNAVSLSKDAVTFGWGANIGIGVGLVAVAIGTVLVLTSKPAGHATGAAQAAVARLLRSGGVAGTF